MIICPHHCNPGGFTYHPWQLSVMPPLVSSRNLFPSRTRHSRKRHATEANSLPSMLSSMTTSAAATIVSFASSSSTSTSKQRARPLTLRARNRRGDRPCTAAVRSDHEIDEVNHKKSYRPIRCDPIAFEHDHGSERSNRRGSIPLTGMACFSTCRNPSQKNCKYVGFKSKSCACIPGVVLHVPAIIPRKPWLSATLMRLELSHLMSSSC